MAELISVVLPVYNGERYLRESIESIIHQTYSNWELIVIDDCSTDNTSEIVKYYKNLDKRIKYYRNTSNLKLPNSLNKGFSITKGEFLTWTSDDNRYRSNAFEKMAECLRSDDQVGIVYASYQIIDEKGNAKDIINSDPHGELHIVGSNVVGACFMYRRIVYEKVGNYDPELLYVEDFDYWQRVLMHFKAKSISEVLYDYRWHDQSMTSTKKLDEYYAALERMLLKNRTGFGKLGFESCYYYYSQLYRIHSLQNGINPYWFKYFTSRWAYNICKGIKKIFGK